MKTHTTCALLLILSYAPSATGVACCFPAQWEGTQTLINGFLVKGTPGSWTAIGKVSFDANISKIAANWTYYQSGQTTHVNYINDYSQGKSYMFSGYSCNVTDLPRPFPGCLPDGYTTLTSTYLGVGSDTLKVSTYSYGSPGGTKGFSSISVTKDCVIVGETEMGQTTATDANMLQVGLTGVTAGIKDKDVFTLPSWCEKYDRKDKEKTLKFKGIERNTHGILPRPRHLVGL